MPTAKLEQWPYNVEKGVIYIKGNHYVGIGNPELLKHDLSDYWSRRIDNKNRIVYNSAEDVPHLRRWGWNIQTGSEHISRLVEALSGIFLPTAKIMNAGAIKSKVI